MAVELSIIIVNWNGGELLRQCVESIGKFPPGVPFDVIVVDNASSDDSMAWLHTDEAKACLGGAALRIIENADNRGFSKANNQGFAESDAPLLFLLNPDAEVRAGAIDALVGTLRSDERIGACGPRLLNTDGSMQPSVWRNPPAAWEILISGLKLYRLLPARLRGELLLGGHWDHARRRTVQRLSGAALLVRRKTIEQAGGLDEKFHMYGEDVEWCFRMARSGWLLVFEPAAVVLHHCSQSSAKRWNSLEVAHRVLDGQLRFQRYSLPRRRLVTNILASSVVASVSHLRRSLNGKPTSEMRMALKLYGEYLRDALRGK
jgi:GT2 family glycosyltransferase